MRKLDRYLENNDSFTFMEKICFEETKKKHFIIWVIDLGYTTHKELLHTNGLDKYSKFKMANKMANK